MQRGRRQIGRCRKISWDVGYKRSDNMFLIAPLTKGADDLGWAKARAYVTYSITLGAQSEPLHWPQSPARALA